MEVVPRLSPQHRAVASELKARSLVMLQRGANRLPFYCVHGAGGDVLNFGDVTRAMDPAQPFYGLQANGIDGVTRPHASIEEMAEAYLAEVRALQPRGPYLLGGYSGGGTVAFEMARRLSESGEEVGLLVFIDTFHPQMPLRRFTFRRRLARLRSEGIAYVIGALRRWSHNGLAAQKERVIRRRIARGEPVPFELRDLQLTRNFERASARYRPGTWAGRAILYRPAAVDPLYADAGPNYGWERNILGGVELVLVPGKHLTLLSGDSAVPLVESLRNALGAAQRRGSRREDTAGGPAVAG
jgi:thioesterase domain-containing protein